MRRPPPPATGSIFSGSADIVSEEWRHVPRRTPPADRALRRPRRPYRTRMHRRLRAADDLLPGALLRDRHGFRRRALGRRVADDLAPRPAADGAGRLYRRSEEHTSEL